MSERKPITRKYLTTLAGKGAFSRGLDYHESGRVLSVKQKGSKITASVDGSQVYRVQLRWTARELDGACDCPASEGFDFCKHCVAVALALQKQQTEQETLKKGGEEERIRAYLLSQDKTQLADWLFSLISDDRMLMQEWSIRADNALGVLDVKTIRKCITKAIPYNRNLYRYNQVRNYFANVELITDHLAEIAAQQSPDDVLKLVDYAISRISRALETVDDSGGFRYTALETLAGAHVQALQRAEWKVEKKVDYLLDITFGDMIDLYPPIPDAYLELMGESGIEYFYRQIQAHWDAMPPLPESADFNDKYPYQRVCRFLEKYAEQHNDKQAVIRLRAKIASELHDYLDLAGRCIDIDDLDGAKKWLDKAGQCEARGFQKIEIKRLYRRWYVAAGNWADAIDIQWEVYADTKAISDYRQLQTMLAQSGEQNEADWHAKAEAMLQAELLEQAKKRPVRPAASLLVEFYLVYGDHARALAVANKEKVDPRLLLELGFALIDMPEQAFPLLQRVTEFHVKQGNNDAYREAIDVLKKIRDEIRTESQQKALNELLCHLRATFRAKRNFIKWLGEAFVE